MLRGRVWVPAPAARTADAHPDGGVAAQLNAEPLDRERIAQLVDEIATLRVQGWKDRIQGIVQVRETLTGEQLERLMAAVQGP